MAPRLHTRIALLHAAIMVLVATALSISLYQVVSWYLTDQRQTASTTRAVLDARAADLELAASASPTAALAAVPATGSSTPLLRVQQRWYASSITVPPDQLPPMLLSAAEPSGARQRFRYAGEAYLAIAIPVSGGLYVEVFPLRDLDNVLRGGAWVLGIVTVLLGLLGAAFGSRLASRVLQPLSTLTASAGRIAAGDFGARMSVTGDPDLDPLASAFNDMASAVEVRIARERRFAANVSHELRSPVTAALGSAEILAAGARQFEPRTAAVVDVLVSQMRRMSTMLLDLLEISKVERDQRAIVEFVDVRTLIENLLLLKGLPCTIVDGDEAQVLSDPRRLERTLGNLIDNAQLHAGGVTGIGIIKQGDAVAVTVEDAGPGIPEEQQEQVFEPFMRGAHTRDIPGAGLGLTIAREQAVAIGATLTVARSPAGGCRFTLLLPAELDADRAVTG